MQQIDEALKCYPQIELYSSPDEIPVMFDKRLTSQRLQAAGITTPPTLRDVRCYDELKAKLQSLGWNRVFVKLACSSSASGVVALLITQQHVRAVTPMEIVGSGLRTQFYNNLKIQVYHRESQVRRAIDFLLREGAHIERWLPKSVQLGRGFDLRMVTIAGKAAHVVMRTSAGPITNLHLGNKRGDIALLKRRMGRQKWEAVKRLVEQAAAAFSKSLYVGFDVLLQPGNRQPAILEANAFGDLLPGVLFRGQNTYKSEVVARMAMNTAQCHAISREIA
jgi:hypothetical protein